MFAKRQLPGLTALAMVAVAGVLKVASSVDDRSGAGAFRPDPLPACIEGWSVDREVRMEAAVHAMLRDDAREWHTYRRGRERADLLVLYGHRKRTFHLPDDCLAGAGVQITDRYPLLLKTDAGAPIPLHALALRHRGEPAVALYAFVGPSGRPTDLLGLNVALFAGRMRGQTPIGAAVRVIGPMDTDTPIRSQAVGELAAAAVEEVGRRVRRPSAAASGSRTGLQAVIPVGLTLAGSRLASRGLARARSESLLLPPIQPAPEQVGTTADEAPRAPESDGLASPPVGEASSPIPDANTLILLASATAVAVPMLRPGNYRRKRAASAPSRRGRGGR